MSEVLKCFTFLAENAPAWIKGLEGLEEKVKARQIEVERIAVPTSRKLKRTGSSESIRPSANNEDNSETRLETTDASQCNVAKAQNSPKQISGSSRRRRMSASALSVTSNSHNKFRTRSQMIVYYDSEVQKAFEQLVHNIGAGRNYIRKARLAIRMEMLTGASAKARAEDDISGRLSTRSTRNASSGYELLLAQGLRSARGLDSLRPDPPTDGYTSTATTDACTLADQGLDKAQAFCETGAYRFLREGECGDEIVGARTIFEEIKRTSDKEVERLTIVELERQKERNAQRLKEQERHQQSRTEVATHPALMSSDGLNEVIEADDDDDEEDDYTLLKPPFRMTART
jgi:hypothetical protein